MTSTRPERPIPPARHTLRTLGLAQVVPDDRLDGPDPIEHQRELLDALDRKGIQQREVPAAFEQILELTRDLSLDLPRSGILDRIVDSCSRLGVAERVLIVLEEDGELVLARSNLPGLREESTWFSRSLVRNCMQKNATDIRVNLPSYPEFASQKSVSDLQLQSAVCLPLRESGRPIGVLCLDSRKHLRESDLVIRILESFAGMASLCLTHLRRVEDEAARAKTAEQQRARAFSELTQSWRTRIIGVSPALQNILEQVEIFKDAQIPILITGESGTGKEVIARALHEAGASTRAGGLISVNCSAIPESLLESELFGTVRGGFSSAVDRPGLVERAHDGTLFLDEIGDMPMPLQSKILRFLEDGSFLRVGDSRSFRRADVRVVAATNTSMERALETGRFRQDLYFRLSAIRLHIPPLRERPEDVPPLVLHFLQTDPRSGQRCTLSDRAMSFLMEQAWPGNVRQLRDTVRVASIYAQTDGSSIELRHLRRTLGLPHDADGDSETEPLDQAMRRTVVAALERALEKHGGSTLQAAMELGVTRQTIYNLMTRYHIQSTRGRKSETGRSKRGGGS